jgi:uncharacterized protein (DUF2461 family)
VTFAVPAGKLMATAAPDASVKSEIAAAARLKNFICLRPVEEVQIRKPALVDDFCAVAADSLPLLKWGWDALADSR